MGFKNDGDDRPPKAERERPSWREIDARRNTSKHVSSDERKRERASSTTGYKSYKSDLDAFFTKGKVSDSLKSRLKDKDLGATPAESQYADLLKQIRSAPDPVSRNALIDTLISNGHQLPDDVDILSAVLDHDDEDLVRGALERMEPLLDTQRLSRKASFVQRLKMLGTMSDHPRTQAVAERLIDRLR